MSRYSTTGSDATTTTSSSHDRIVPNRNSARGPHRCGGEFARNAARMFHFLQHQRFAIVRETANSHLKHGHFSRCRQTRHDPATHAPLRFAELFRHVTLCLTEAQLNVTRVRLESPSSTAEGPSSLHAASSIRWSLFTHFGDLLRCRHSCSATKLNECCSA